MAKRLWAIGLDEDCIWIMTDRYDPDANAALKANLPGPPRWNREKGRWQFPVHWDTCTGARKIANKFDADLRMTKALIEWATAEKAHQASIPDVQGMNLVDLPRVREQAPAIWSIMSNGIPELGYPPRPYQTVGAAFAARNRVCLIADQPGLGKTIQTIAAIVEADVKGPILVVAPKAAVELTWPQELKRWLPDDEFEVIDAKTKPAARSLIAKQAASFQKRHWILTSPNYIRIRAEVDEYNHYVKVNGRKVIKPVGVGVLELFDVDWAAIVVDESHQTLAGATGNLKKQSAQRLGLGALTTRDGGLRIALSGTPFRGKECYLWGQLNWLRPDKYRAYWTWVKKHFNVRHNGWGWDIGKMINAEGMYSEARDVMIRRTKPEVAADLPAKLYGGWPLDISSNSPVAVWLDMEPKQAQAYEAMVVKATVDLEGGQLMTNGILAELTRLKQFAGSYGKMSGEQFVPTLPSNKFDWLVEMLDERGIDGDLVNQPDLAGLPKVVVASQFSQLIDAFAEGLAEKGIKAHVFTGATSDKKREVIKDDWQNCPESDTRVLLLTTTAGGVSLTLDAADELVLLDHTWSFSDQEQVEDRLHRLSRIHQVVIWNVLSRGTIEEGIARANLEKEVSIKSIIDGARGHDFVRSLIAGQ